MPAEPNVPTSSIPPPFMVTGIPSAVANANAADRSFTSSTQPLPAVSFQFTLYILLLYIRFVSVSMAEEGGIEPRPAYASRLFSKQV